MKVSNHIGKLMQWGDTVLGIIILEHEKSVYYSNILQDNDPRHRWGVLKSDIISYPTIIRRKPIKGG